MPYRPETIGIEQLGEPDGDGFPTTVSAPLGEAVWELIPDDTSPISPACSARSGYFEPDRGVMLRVGGDVPGILAFAFPTGEHVVIDDDRGPELTGVYFASGDSARQILPVAFQAICGELTGVHNPTVRDSARKEVQTITPPNCPDGSNRYILGSLISVIAGKIQQLNVSTVAGVSLENGFKSFEGIVPGTQWSRGEDDNVWRAFVVMNTEGKYVTAHYASDEEQVESGIIEGLKISLGIVAVALPLLLTSVVCLPCGLALSAIAVTTLIIDQVPGVGDEATALFDLINPMGVMSCAAQWGFGNDTLSADTNIAGLTVAETGGIKGAVGVAYTSARITQFFEGGASLTKATTDTLTTGQFGQGVGVAAFGVGLYTAGIGDIEVGFETVEGHRDTALFTDCLHDKARFFENQ